MFGAGLIKGLWVTGNRMVRPAKCDMYPYRKRDLPRKSRTFLALRLDEAGQTACKACMTCEKGCPDHVIAIEKDPTDPKRALTFTVDSGRCTFCGICEENCPFDALEFTGDFERATFDRDALVYKLIEDGQPTGEGSRRG